VWNTRPVDVKTILQTNFDNFVKVPLVEQQFGDLLGKGIFMVGLFLLEIICRTET